MNCNSYQESWGGKGLNQVIALRRAGESPYFCTKVGEKDYSSLRDLLVSRGIEASHVIPMKGQTNHGVIQITPQGRTAIIGAPNAAVNFTWEEIHRQLELTSEGDMVLLQNEIDKIPDIIRAAKEKGCMVVLNPSPLCDGMKDWPLEYVDILILNETEGRALSGKTCAEDILSELLLQCPDGGIVLTLGEKGSIFQNRTERVVQPSFPVKAVDTLAAGDTFTGYFLACYGKTGSASDSLATAAKAAAIVVGRRGAAEVIPSMEEVIKTAKCSV